MREIKKGKTNNRKGDKTIKREKGKEKEKGERRRRRRKIRLREGEKK